MKHVKRIEKYIHMFFRMYKIELLLFVFEVAIVVGTVIMCFVDKGNITSWIQTGIQAATLVPVLIYFVQKLSRKRIIIREGSELFQELKDKSDRITAMIDLILEYQYQFLTEDNSFADDKVSELNDELDKVQRGLFANHYSYQDFEEMSKNVSMDMLCMHLTNVEIQKDARKELDCLKTRLIHTNEKIFEYYKLIIQTLRKQKYPKYM